MLLHPREMQILWSDCETEVPVLLANQMPTYQRTGYKREHNKHASYSYQENKNYLAVYVPGTTLLHCCMPDGYTTVVYSTRQHPRISYFNSDLLLLERL